MRPSRFAEARLLRYDAPAWCSDAARRSPWLRTHIRGPLRLAERLLGCLLVEYEGPDGRTYHEMIGKEGHLWLVTYR